MDEFRYFEAVQRHREETYALIRLIKEESGKLNLNDLLKSNYFYSTAAKLGPGETTELLESRKLTKDEMDIFMKIVDAVSVAKK